MQQHAVAVIVNGKLDDRGASIEFTACILGDGDGYVLCLHIKRFVRVARSRIQKFSRPLRILHGRVRPEVGCEEGDRAFEILRVQKQSPAIVSGGDIDAVRRCFRRKQRQSKIAVTEKLPANTLTNVQTVKGEKQPRTELRHSVETSGMAPISCAETGTVCDVTKVRSHAPHDELRSHGRKLRGSPPSKPAFDIRIEMGGRGAIILRRQPCSEKSALEPMSLILFSERISSRVNRKACIVRIRHSTQ